MGDQNDLISEMAKLKVEVNEIKENFHEITSTTKTASRTILQNEIMKQEEKEPNHWNDLPNELKLKIVEKCDFKTRIHVAKTCRSGKELVGRAKPITWERLKMQIREHSVCLTAHEDGAICMTKNYSNSLRSLLNAIVNLFKSEVEFFEIETRDGVFFPNWFIDELSKNAPFNFRKLRVISFSRSTTRCKFLRVFIENRGLPLETIQCSITDFIHHTCDDFTDFIDRVYMNTCRELQLEVFVGIHYYGFVITHVLKHWIDKDVPIGTTFSLLSYCGFMCGGAQMLNNLISTFNLGNSQFLMRREGDEVKTMNGKPKTILIRISVYFDIHFHVIPTELRPSEYKEFIFGSRVMI